MLGQTPVTKVELELTEACNLQCRFCYNSCEPAYCQNALAIIDRLERGGVLELVLTGGEPSEHPDFFKILRYACDRIPRVMVQSNGVNFGQKKYFEQLAALPVACVNFSLHGLQQTHESLTQIPGSFDATVQAIRWCLESGIRVASNMVLTAINSDPARIKELVSLHAGLGMREMTVTRFIPCGCGEDAADLKIGHYSFLQALDTLLEESERRGVSFLLANATPRCKVEQHHEALCNRCSFGYDKFYVDVSGNILTCGMSRLPVGNVLHGDLKTELSQSDIRKRYFTNTHIPIKCRDCTYLEICGGGCRAAALATGGDLEAEDPLVFKFV